MLGINQTFITQFLPGTDLPTLAGMKIQVVMNPFFALLATTFAVQSANSDLSEKKFYHQISQADELCIGPNGPSPSFAGWIGLKGDTDTNPKRSFFWYWHAEENSEDAPIVLSMGGGPGSSGMMNAMLYEAPCLLSGPNGTTRPNEERWTEKFNLLALDHVGTAYTPRPLNTYNANTSLLELVIRMGLE